MQSMHALLTQGVAICLQTMHPHLDVPESPTPLKVTQQPFPMHQANAFEAPHDGYTRK